MRNLIHHPVSNGSALSMQTISFLSSVAGGSRGTAPWGRPRCCLALCAAAALTAVHARADGPVATATPARPMFVELPSEGVAQFLPAEDEKEVPARFRQEAAEFGFTAKLDRQSGTVRVHRVTFPSPVKTEVEANNTVHGHYFQPAGEGPFPGVVVLHILGGDFPLSQAIANGLARENVAALFIRMPYYGERRAPGHPRRMISRDPRETAEGMTQAVLDIRRAAAWLRSRPEVSDVDLGVTGISLGGIMSALSGGVEPRFKKVGIVLGGGNLASTLWESSNREVGDFQKEWLAKGETRESFEAILKPVDPVTYAERLRGRMVLMVNAEHDEIIPKSATLALYEAIGREPELVWLEGAGHYTAAQYLPREIERLKTFFNRPLQGRPGAP